MIPAHREWVYTCRRDALPLPPSYLSSSSPPEFFPCEGLHAARLRLGSVCRSEEHRPPGSSHSTATSNLCFFFFWEMNHFLLPLLNSPPPPSSPFSFSPLKSFFFFDLRLHQRSLTCTSLIGWLVGVLKAPQFACATAPRTTFCPSFFVFQLRL